MTVSDVYKRQVTVSAKAASQKEASINLKEGEILTVEDLIYAALLPSGNDAAYALGEAVSGDMETFIALMNKTAKNIGCKKTHFTNPSGMQAKRHYTTASDMMEIVKVALSNDIIRKAAGSTKYTIETVSYTHLDVYKKQGTQCSVLDAKGRPFVSSCNNTHVDVDCIHTADSRNFALL